MKRRIFIGTAAIAVLMTFLVGYLATVRINNASERAIQQRSLQPSRMRPLCAMRQMPWPRLRG